ncbi:MAG: hypothetical protein H0Z37_02440 [Firmicutes bacterium]|nr:hypothetical protein [Bacillota bacterium]
MKPSPAVDVLAWDVAAACSVLAAVGITVTLRPAGSPASAGACRWRVARQKMESGGEVVLTIVPEVEGSVPCPTPLPLK